MGLLDFIMRRTPAETDPPPAIAMTPEAARRNADTVVVEAATDEPPAQPFQAGAGETVIQYVLEPYFAMIEYTDSKGTGSRRRIKMLTITEQDGVRILQAFCHERKAVRHFRLDRISCIISQDGEVEDAAEWFKHILAISEKQIVPAPQYFNRAPRQPDKPRPAAAPNVSPYTALRRELTPAMTFLIASARSDEILHPREMDRILRYAEDEMVVLRGEGRVPEGVEAEAFDKLDRTIRRLRPTREDLVEALAALASWPEPRLKRLGRALADTARADGRVDDIEAALIEDLRNFGAQRHGYGWNN